MQVFEEEILIPHIVYQKNPIKAIKGVLGNDVNIISYTVSDIMTTNEEFLIKVVYSSIDFSPFEIYKVKNVKRINTNSDKYIGELDNENDVGKIKVYIKLNQNVKDCYVKINTLSQNNIDNDVIYYGDIIGSIQDIMTNFCSAFCTVKLSYHGTNIVSNIPKDVKFKDLLSRFARQHVKHAGPSQMVQNREAVLKSETSETSEISETSETSESDEDKKIFDNFQSMSHEYSRNYFDISYLKQQISNKVNILKPNTTEIQIRQPGIYSFENLTLEELKEVLLKIKTGIFFLLSERTNPCYFIYIPNHEIQIKPYLIEHMLIVISKDIENIKKFSEK